VLTKIISTSITSIGVSACFIAATRYDGKQKENHVINKYLSLLQAAKIAIVPLCPEQLGGLPTPRSPAEIVQTSVLNKQGQDVSAQFIRGAQETLHILQATQTTVVLFKQKSPSCGKGKIMDGTFSNVLTSGDGITTQLLEKNGIAVFTEETLPELIDYLQAN
jgi:uncharacterized protein YbbK (DUF523 family)